MLGRAFTSGNSLAVRIPRDLGVVEEPGDVEIERVGNTLVIRSLAARSLVGALDRFAAFPPGFMAGGREFHDENERDW